MSASVSLSVRVAPDLRERLEDLALSQGKRPATLAAELLATAIDDPSPEAEDGPLVDAVTDLFKGMDGHGVPLRREAALALARVVDQGGSPAVLAVRTLLDIVAELFDAEEPEFRAFLADLGTPVAAVSA
ncbi:MULTISPECIES: hypothetical protein [unclassified Nocardiopsis]|uniref:hypothetical protein n=1 Tax=unclassified Nocardiopsis TaxID=2649073 RepID=UPI001357E131|nr:MULTISPECIES: hypothetical protein [unclassified Nocardiopsis]